MTLTAAQRQRLRAIFPNGVGDWKNPASNGKNPSEPGCNTDPHTDRVWKPGPPQYIPDSFATSCSMAQRASRAVEGSMTDLTSRMVSAGNPLR